jgi:diguanylate cyclase (GGDEF)-like protein
MLRAAFTLYIGIILIAVIAALLIPQASTPVLLGTSAFAVVGAVIVALVYRREAAVSLNRMVLAYLSRLEDVVRDFGASKSLEKQVREMASFLHRQLDFGAVCVLARKRATFVPVESLGFDKKAVNRVKIDQHDTLIKALESRQTVLSVDRFYAAAAKKNPFAETELQYVVPVLSANKCSHLILVSDSGFAPFKMMRPFLLALSDQVGNYKLLEDTRKHHSQQMAKAKKQQRDTLKEIKARQKGGRFGAEAIVAAQNKLLRIFNREQLYPTLLETLGRYFKAETGIAFLPGKEGSEYEPAFRRGKSDIVTHSSTLKPDSPIFDLLEQSSRPVAISAMKSTLQHRPELQGLEDAGITHITLLSDSKVGKVLLGVGRANASFSEEEIEGIHSLCGLFNLVLTNIGHFERIEELSYTDSMTGLYNYRYFYKRLREEIFRARRFSRQLALVIFDIDGFKVFNDTYGHQSGDYLLEQLGRLLVSSVRSIDVVSRYGGEEFCVIMPEADREDCQNFMERMRVKILDNEFLDKFTNDHHRITVSLGGAIYPNDAQRVDRLIYCADMALLEAKNSGRNKAFMFDKSFAEKKQVS